MTIIQAILTDRTESSDVNKLNDLMKSYRELIDPKIKKDRKQFETNVNKNMDELFAKFEKFTKSNLKAVNNGR